MSEIEKKDNTIIKSELTQLLERAKLVIQDLDEIFGPGTRVFYTSSIGSCEGNQLELWDGEDYRITLLKITNRK